MKVMTVAGTRPELIRLSNIIPLLDKYTKHQFVWTDQNYDPNLKDIFFDDMQLRPPDSFVDRNNMQKGCEELIDCYEPDKVLILGDTHSGAAAAQAAAHYDVPIYHMEAGNRCFLNEVPEERNRFLIDNLSTVLMPYTENSRLNLIREGFPPNHIFVIGNPIREVLERYQFGCTDEKRRSPYFLVTLHRAETVDNKARLLSVLGALSEVSIAFGDTPVILSEHPHLKDSMKKFKLTYPPSVHPHKPFGIKEFIQLEKHAICVLSDSGTVQEECAILNTPLVILRDVTERPETIENGCGIIGGRSDLVDKVKFVVRYPVTNCPTDYLKEGVSMTVVKIVLSEVPP